MAATAVNRFDVLYQWNGRGPAGAFVADARSVLRRSLAERQIPQAAVDDCVLAASELVANASEHALGPYEMRLRHTACCLICEVRDRSPVTPGLLPRPEAWASVPGAHPYRDPPGEPLDLLTERGRGLRVVHALTHGRWGFRQLTGEAKVVWCVLPGVRGCTATHRPWFERSRTPRGVETARRP